MGRIRHIKPEFFLDEELANHKAIVRLLFVGLWTLADCEGRMEERPARIKAQLFPYESLDMESSLGALVSTRHILRYVAEGKGYLQVTNFLKHQRLSGKEAAAMSLFPGPEDSVKRLGSTGEEPGSDGEAADVQGREGKEREGKECKSKSIPSLTPLKTKETQEAFERIWKSWPTTRPADGKAAKGARIPAERNVQQILDGGQASISELEEAVQFYLEHHPNVKSGYVVMVSTFFGPEKALWAEAVRTLRDRRLKASGESK